MARARVPLTRSTLLETQRSLSFAQEGYNLLDRKREILLSELTAETPGAEQARDALISDSTEAYGALAGARMAVGVDSVRRVAMGTRGESQLEIRERSIVGAVVPEIRCALPERRPGYSLISATAEVDAAVIAFAQLTRTICRAAETEIAAVRLATEIRKTQRRVNALRNVVIPRQESIIKEVREALEDAEREAFFQLKRLRAQREKRAAR